MRLVAIIPARSNSKRLPGKNFMEINGHSLLERAVTVAEESAIFSEIWTTSDIYLGPYSLTRHPYMVDDDVHTATVVFDFLCRQDYRYDAFCVLNPTSPLRTADLVRDCWKMWREWDADCLMTMVPGSGLDSPPTHDGTALFAKTLPFLRALDFWKMNRKEFWISDPTVDVNNQEDFTRAEKYLIEREGACPT